MKGAITFCRHQELAYFCLGDILNTGHIVTGVDRKRCALVVRKATRFWRLWMRVRLAPRRAWWRIRCALLDIFP